MNDLNSEPGLSLSGVAKSSQETVLALNRQYIDIALYSAGSIDATSPSWHTVSWCPHGHMHNLTLGLNQYNTQCGDDCVTQCHIDE
jgi:hypothetical protein